MYLCWKNLAWRVKPLEMGEGRGGPKMMFQGGKNSAKAGVKKPPKTSSEPSFFSIHT